MVGMLAAITVPSLLEYRRHAEIGQQLSQVTAFKTVMADFYVAQGRFPTEDELSDAFASLEAAPIASQIEIEPDTGVIVLYVTCRRNSVAIIECISCLLLRVGLCSGRAVLSSR